MKGGPSPSSGTTRRRRIQAFLHQQLDARWRRAPGLSITNKVLVGLILFSAALAMLETEPTLTAAFGAIFEMVELAVGLVFAVEYLVRLWTAPLTQPTAPAWRTRVRFVFSPAALADLGVVLVSLWPAGSSTAMLLRVVRLVRIMRLAKLGRMSRAMTHILAAISSRRDELLISLLASLSLIVAAATALYFVEGPAQPEKFGSIPRALWWAVTTMTTIGYGDVYPITLGGRVLAALAAIISIGLVAMPTGIIAAAFSDAMVQHRQERESDRT